MFNRLFITNFFQDVQDDTVNENQSQQNNFQLSHSLNQSFFALSFFLRLLACELIWWSRHLPFFIFTASKGLSSVMSHEE